MTGVETILARCRELGATLTPSPDGKLKVKAPAPLPEDLREELRQHKAAVLATLTAWLCPYCGNPVEIDDVGPSRDGTYTLTFSHCTRCQVWTVTPSALQEPPVWVSSKVQ